MRIKSYNKLSILNLRTTNHEPRTTRHGLTLIELIITVVMFVILATVAMYIFRAVLLSWSSGQTKAGIDIILDRGVEEMVRDLRGSKDIDSVNDDEVRFTTLDDDYYIYYFYNEEDSYPPDFEKDLYELRLADLENVVGEDLTTGTFNYGDGRIIITDILPPDTTDLSISGSIVTIDMSISRGNETVRSRTEVKQRNL